MVRIGHVMKRELVSVDYGQAVSVAATLMKTRGIGSVLVKHEEEIGWNRDRIRRGPKGRGPAPGPGIHPCRIYHEFTRNQHS